MRKTENKEYCVKENEVAWTRVRRNNRENIMGQVQAVKV